MKLKKNNNKNLLFATIRYIHYVKNGRGLLYPLIWKTWYETRGKQKYGRSCVLTVIFATCFVTESVIRRGIKLSMVDGEKEEKKSAVSYIFQ